MVGRIIEVTRRGRQGEQGNPGSTAFEAVTTAGSSTVYTLTNGTPIVTYADGYGVTIDAHVTNSATPTMNVDGLGAVPIKKLSGGSSVAIVAGDIVADNFYMIHYSAVEIAFILFGRKNDTIGADLQEWSADLDNVLGTNTGDEVLATTSKAGIVEKATVVESEEGTEADKFPDVVRQKQAIEALAPISAKSYASSGQTITSAGLLTLSHSLGEVPKLITGYVKCTSAENGFSVGDEVLVTLVNNSDSGASRGNAIYFDATNIYVRFTSVASVFLSANKGSGVFTTLTNASWDLYVRAWA